jgi:phospholipase/lecithinase/hemolysin
MRPSTLIVIATFVICLTGPAVAKPFNNVWVFGDSTVDTGWYEKSPYSGIASYDVYFPQSHTDKFGMPTDNPGPMSVQSLANTLGLSVTSQNRGGTDYATGGARNNEKNVSGSGFFINAVPTIKQITHYMNNNTPSSHGLYVISSGGNDVSYAVKQVSGGHMTNAQGQDYVKNAAHLLGAKIKTLQTGGATHIIVANQPKDFGPSTDNTKPYRQLYNTTLQNKLNNESVKHAWGDVNGVRHGIIDDPADFGITNVNNATPACTTPNSSTGITTGWAFLCSASSPVSTPTAQNVATTLFADDQHWTSTAQKILGSYYYCLAKHKWSGAFNGWTKTPPYACSLFGL